jgi:hypothetical protein
MGDFSDLNTGHVKERSCRAVSERGFADWQREQQARADLLTVALERYNHGRMKRYLCELFIREDLQTIQEIMNRANSLQGSLKEKGTAFQQIVRDVLSENGSTK